MLLDFLKWGIQTYPEKQVIVDREKKSVTNIRHLLDG